MVTESERLISEIVQIKDQYVSEVGSGRRVWPKAIKERIARLDEIGLAPKVVSVRTGIPYDTIVLWRYNRRHGVHGRLKNGFHQLNVANSSENIAEPIPNLAKCILKSVAVTAQETKISKDDNFSTGSRLRLTTPDGFTIEGLNDDQLVHLIRSLSRSGGSHVV